MAPEVASPGYSGPPALEVRNLAKTFAGNKALTGVDLTVGAGEVRCLVGGNGSGKSTLIKILSGYHQPDPGAEIHLGGELLHTGHPKEAHRLGARFVHQDLGLVLDASVTDNLFLGDRFPLRLGMVNARAARRHCQKALDRLGLDVHPDTLVKDLSPAQRTGVAIARAIAAGGGSIRLLVLDEPTATLPAAEVGALLAIVRSVAEAGVGVLYVTHRLEEVFKIGAAVTVFRSGHEIATEPIAGLTRQSLVELIVGEEVAEVHRDHALPLAARPDPVLSVDALTGRTIAGVTFDVAPGDIVGVAGVTGSGREELNACIFGAVARDGGTIIVAGQEVRAHHPTAAIRAGMAFLPAERRTHGGLMSLSATENLTIPALKDFWSAPSLRTRAENDEAERWFDRLSVQPPGAWRSPLTSFSGGNQQKILLGKWLRLKPAVLLLDEPTQGVDAAATAEIYRQLLGAAERGAALVVATSDVDELVALCNRVLVIDGGVLVKELAGEEVNVGSVTSWSLGATNRRKAVQV